MWGERGGDLGDCGGIIIGKLIEYRFNRKNSIQYEKNITDNGWMGNDIMFLREAFL